MYVIRYIVGGRYYYLEGDDPRLFGTPLRFEFAQQAYGYAHRNRIYDRFSEVAIVLEV